MSHQPERTDKNCLNCGTLVQGRFCHVCGQENIIIHQSFFSLAKHFIYDIFHFDGKFYDTVKGLFWKPGRVASEYVKGRRMRYLDPIRMYLFTSAVFFLIFVRFFNDKEMVETSASRKPYTVAERQVIIDSLQNQLKDSPAKEAIKRKLALLKDTTQEVSANVLSIQDIRFLRVDNQYNNFREYDSAQKSLPDSAKDGWFERGMMKKSFDLGNRYQDSRQTIEALRDEILHRLPLMIFFSLPFFALILKLLYARGKQFFYSDHAIFTIYQYISSFILLLLMFTAGTLAERTKWVALNWVLAILIFYGGFHLLRSMKTFYGQGWGKTIGKFLLLNLLGGLILLICFTALFFISIIEL